jgi:hypothetical protein
MKAVWPGPAITIAHKATRMRVHIPGRIEAKLTGAGQLHRNTVGRGSWNCDSCSEIHGLAVALPTGTVRIGRARLITCTGLAQ